MKQLLERSIVADSGCWEWRLSRLPNGYGRVSRDRGLLAHRWAWVLAHGPIPDGLCVLHRCDNRCCVNPAHLWLGTKRDNSQDALAKGRIGKTPPHTYKNWRPGRSMGEANGSARLTKGQASAIRCEYSSGNVLQRELAAKYGVSQVAISNIVRGSTWA